MTTVQQSLNPLEEFRFEVGASSVTLTVSRTGMSPVLHVRSIRPHISRTLHSFSVAKRKYLAVRWLRSEPIFSLAHNR